MPTPYSSRWVRLHWNRELTIFNTWKPRRGKSRGRSADGADVWLTDAKGGKSKVTIADVNQSNGVIHVVDTVLMP